MKTATLRLVPKEEPPQGIVIPDTSIQLPKHHVIKLNPEDAARFHAGFEEVRAKVPSHWMKSKEHDDFKQGNTTMFGIEQDGELAAGILVTTFKRHLGNKLHWYPWESNGEHTGLVGSVWVKVAHCGMGKALLAKAIEEIKNSSDVKGDELRNGLKYAMAGIAADNVDSRALFNKAGFQQVGPIKPDPTHGKPMVYVRAPILCLDKSS